MATQVFSDDPGALTGAFYFDGTDAGTGMQSGVAAVSVDDEANQGPQGEKVGGDASDFAGGPQASHNPALPGSMEVAGQPAGSVGTGSTGVVGEIING